MPSFPFFAYRSPFSSDENPPAIGLAPQKQDNSLYVHRKKGIAFG